MQRLLVLAGCVGPSFSTITLQHWSSSPAAARLKHLKPTTAFLRISQFLQRAELPRPEWNKRITT